VTTDTPAPITVPHAAGSTTYRRRYFPEYTQHIWSRDLSGDPVSIEMHHALDAITKRDSDIARLTAQLDEMTRNANRLLHSAGQEGLYYPDGTLTSDAHKNMPLPWDEVTYDY